MLFGQRVIGAVLLALGLVTHAAVAEVPQITGTAGYRERIALPEGAVLSVQLQDVSLMDAAAITLSSQMFQMTSVPRDFALTFDPALIDDRHTYSVRAEIILDGTVLFRTTQTYPVLTREAGSHVDLMLEKAALSADADPASLVLGKWEVDELYGMLLRHKPRPQFVFEATGRVSFEGGCNIYNGSYEVSEESLKFIGPALGTLMACSEDQETIDSETLAALGDTVDYVREGEVLSLVNDEGATVARLRLK